MVVDVCAERGRGIPVPRASRVRKSALRFVLERAVRRALRLAEDWAVIAVCWAATAEEGDAGLAFIALETMAFAFGARSAIGAVFVAGCA